jgi:release factor glutamine methyltransferase
MLGAAQQWTVSAARRQVAACLRSSSIESADADARLLVGHALGLDRTGLVSSAGRILSRQEIDAINALVARRQRHEPVARIVGGKEFWSLPLRVSSATLVPRPETETVVEAALAFAGDRKRALRMADLGTGTGAILLALLTELPNATGIGTDIDPLALATANENAQKLGFGNRAEFVHSDFGSTLTETFDIVVSNPPYIAAPDLSALEPDVRDYDPRLALDGGPDGLDCYRRIAAEAARLLKPGGVIVLEIGAGQTEAVTAIFQTCGLKSAAPPRPDLAGIPRALVFRVFS